eukprot:CAMPEP_0117445796 /NCGR_PEP_ID=MMETSP0759-20121206/5988_1 /TAXON_ID=63605 /ORGANISM="Percolomonas cosmopolitus, Strain WS" /LENGTH=255 /DNA_ID=CAMNT_0005237999 /DNA_START=37 /DNA_END=801 /DNA_ORIENTATION=+
MNSDTPHFFQITKRIFLSDLVHASNAQLLKKCNITHVITAIKDKSPIAEHEHMKRLNIPIHDMVSEDLVHTYGDTILQFYENCRNTEGGNLLVHCVHGMSRSVAIVAFILIVKGNIDFDAALNVIRSKTHRDDMEPNIGFQIQLQQVHAKMNGGKIGYELDEGKDGEPTHHGIYCKKCRGSLFLNSDILEHTNEKNHMLPYSRLKKENRLNSRRGDECSSFFVSRMDWMGEMKDQEGTLFCPKCDSKIGNYKWRG